MATAGRPTKYKEKYAKQAEKLCAKGFTDKDLAEFFEVSESTINKWKLDAPKFSESLKMGKEKHDSGKVEETLLKRALGYEVSESKIEQQEGSPAKKTLTKKHIPPSDTALIFWLKNRDPSRWRDKQEVDHQSSDGSMSPKGLGDFYAEIGDE